MDFSIKKTWQYYFFLITLSSFVHSNENEQQDIIKIGIGTVPLVSEELSDPLPVLIKK